MSGIVKSGWEKTKPWLLATSILRSATYLIHCPTAATRPLKQNQLPPVSCILSMTLLLTLPPSPPLPGGEGGKHTLAFTKVATLSKVAALPLLSPCPSSLANLLVPRDCTLLVVHPAY